MDAEAQINKAMEHWISGELAMAEGLLLDAAKSGSSLAAHNLGTLYAIGGPGVEQDTNKSRQWFEAALASGFEATVASDPQWFKNAT